MSKNYDLNLDLPLIPGKGIGDIEIGEHIGTYFPSIQEKKLGIVNVIAWPWRLYEYILWDSISIGVDVFSGIVVRIEVYNQFRGKYMDQIGIGSSVANLDTVREDLSFGEDRIVVGDGDFIMVTDYDGLKQAPWYNLHVKNDPEFFGYWSFETAAVVKLWEIDDRPFADNMFYPRDLVPVGRNSPAAPCPNRPWASPTTTTKWSSRSPA